jgi:hypothetical protein
MLFGGARLALSQGVGTGTAVVVLRAPDVLFAAVDSNENYLLYRNGIPTLDRRTVCKVAQAGPYFAIVAGIANGTNGFDALRETEKAWRPGTGLDALAEEIRQAVPRQLTPLMQSLYDADSAAFVRQYRGQTALQLLLVGAEGGVPEMRVVEFTEAGASGSVVLSGRTSACRGECLAGRTAWFLGTHDRIDQFVKAHSASIRHPDEGSLDKLIGLEYQDRPDLVGGPVSMLKVTRTGGTMIRAGACSLNEAAQ